MKVLRLCYLLGLTLAGSFLFADEELPGPDTAKQEAMLDALFALDPNDEAGYIETVEHFKDNGLDAQEVLEVELFYRLFWPNAEQMEALLGRMNDIQEWTFLASDTLMLTNINDVNALREAYKAWIALEKGNNAGFESHVKEAFWTEPEIAVVIGGWITDYRNAKAAAASYPMDLDVALNIPLDRSAGGSTTLWEILNGKKGLVIDFWASWCGPCMRNMPHIIEEAAKYEPLGVQFVGINLEDTQAAERVRQEFGISFDWLVDNKEGFYANAFEVESIPRIVILDAKGKALYNGHPQSDKMVKALNKLIGLDSEEDKANEAHPAKPEATEG